MPDQTVTAKFLADIGDFQSKMRDLTTSAKEAQASAKELSTSLSSSGGGMQELDKNASKASESTMKVGGAAREARGGLQEMVSSFSQSVSDWQQLIQLAVQFVQAIESTRDASMATAGAFRQLTGSEQEAQRQLQLLNSTYAAQDFGKKAVNDAAQYFLMLGKDANVTEKEIERVGDAIAAMGGDAKQLTPAIEQMHKIQQETRVTHDDIDALAKDGVAGWDALAAGMTASSGKLVTVAEAQKRVDEGAVTGKQAYQDMMEGMMKYTGAAQQQAESFGSSWQQVGQEAAEAFGPLAQELAKFLHTINECIAAVKSLKEAISSIGGGAFLGGVGQMVNAVGLNPLGPLSALGGFASGGTNLPQGWRVVGEDGPEIQYSPGGDTIIPSGADPMTFLGGSSGGGSALASIGGMGSITIHLTTTTMLDSRVVAQQTIPHIAPMLRQQFARRS